MTRVKTHREVLGYDDDSQARRDALVAAYVATLEHPCGHCGLREGAGAAGLCLECNEEADAEELTEVLAWSRDKIREEGSIQRDEALMQDPRIDDEA